MTTLAERTLLIKPSVTLAIAAKQENFDLKASM